MRERVARVERAVRPDRALFMFDVLNEDTYMRVDRGKRETLSTREYEALRRRFPDAVCIIDDLRRKP